MQTFNISNRTLLVIAAGAIVAIAIAFGIGWGLVTGGDRIDQAGAQAELGTSASPAAPTPAAPTPDGTGSPDEQTGGDDQTGGGQPAPPPVGPRIEFRVAQEPRCPRGTTQAPIEGRPLVLEWRVAGTDTVTLSVDGPGVYGTYPAEDSETFGFSCGGEPGDIEQHTYVLTATVDGQTVTEELVVEAEVYEIVIVE